MIFLVPETVQVLNESSKDKLLAGYYKEALGRYAAESAGIIAPSGDDLRKANIGKL